MDISIETADFVVEEMAALTDISIAVTDRHGKIISGEKLGGRGIVSPDARRAVEQNETVELNRMNPPFIRGTAIPVNYQGEPAGGAILYGKQKNIDDQISMLSFAVDALIERAVNAHQGVYRQRQIESWIANLFDESYLEWEKLEEGAEEYGIKTDQNSSTIVLAVIRHRTNRNTPGALASLSSSFIENYLTRNFSLEFHVNFYCYLGRNIYALNVTSSQFQQNTIVTAKKELIQAVKELNSRMTAINLSCVAGIGTIGNGLRHIRQSFHEANASMELARKFQNTDRSIMHVYDWGIQYFISQIPKETISHFVKQYAFPTAERKPELEDTLSVFFEENCSVQKTAERMNVHKNTLLYRLKRCTEVFGLNPQKFDEAVILYLLLKMRDIFPETPAQLYRERI